MKLTRRLGALAAFVALITATPGAALADPAIGPGFPHAPIQVAPCSSLGPIDWWGTNQGGYARDGIRYIVVSTTPVFELAYGRFNENRTDQTINGNWTATESRTVTMTASITLTIQGGRANPETLALTVTLATGFQIQVSRTTSIGVGATAPIPPFRTMLGEYGLQSFDVVMDVHTVGMRHDMQTCEYRLGSNVTRETAHVPTINEGWRFTLT
ncbi:hypothetical protein [Virgisporangium aurantiacum]|uniref:Uncharacterized protein n=1 Tax=Virgisporangium aurantiacum TaxID=175570 RepID=A0A8J3Z3Q1_9ACTN|nr:hypothetical protein [Virgisporangium aurantiacum]GIJ56132.1 hypothetical protein Vau01_036480 [Virgisporangium aurantiacum]